MKVLLINPMYDPETLNYLRMNGFPIGLLSIATYLNSHGHEAKILDRTFFDTPLEEVLSAQKPDVVGISMIANMCVPDVIAVSDFFRGRGVPVYIGGTYASIVPEIILKENKADLVIVSEGEQIWLNLMNALRDGADPHTVNGIVYMGENGEPVFTPPEPFMDLSLLGPADFTLLPNVKDYFQPCYCYDNMAHVYLSKGCTGNCSFCFNSYFHRCKRRVRPVSVFFDEIEYLIREHGLETVYFADELWGLTKTEREEIYREKQRRGLTFTWGCQTRIGVLKKEDLREMYDNGCRWVFFGIEAPPGHLAEIANKRLPYPLVLPTLEAAREVGLITNVSFIFNYPHETVQDLRDTVQYMQSLPATYMSVAFFAPFERSALFEQVVREGLYDPPKTLEEIRQGALIEKIHSSFSEVPDRDYKVIRACFLVQDLFSRYPEQIRRERPKSFFWETVKTSVLNIFSMKVGQWLHGLYYSAKYFLSMVGNALLFPGIRRKYGFRFRFRR